MRIRELYFHNFRSFRGEHRVSFVDPVTDTPYPVSVLAGSNGCGKTTVLEAIEALLAFVIDPDNPRSLIVEAQETGLICLALELEAEDLNKTDAETTNSPASTGEVFHIAVGLKNLAPENFEAIWPNLFCKLVQWGRPFARKSSLAAQLRKAVIQMQQPQEKLQGGLLYFPHDRRLGSVAGGPIEPPPSDHSWLFHFNSELQWRGSLEQLWVWQNYLDLEGEKTGRAKTLVKFVEAVQNVLGTGRPIEIEEGRVRVATPWGDKVKIDQLPSGEQQVLLLFGELVRRARPKMVIAIDEVENSLHPTLQRLVMANLRQLARKFEAQVIVTTHSLEVINSVRGGAFINLDSTGHFNLPVDEETEAVA